MSQYKGYLIDLDGTIYIGKKRLLEAEQFIKKLQKQNIPFLFVTNNSTKTPQIVQQFLKEHCFLDVEQTKIYTSAMAAIDYVKKLNIGNRAFIIGSDSFKSLCKEQGFILDENTPDFILQGLDINANYNLLKRASFAIQKGAKYIVTNNDYKYPTEEGFIPGSGAIMSFLIASTQVEPIIIGKPYFPIMDGALKTIGLDAKDVIMVGDNYNTDILAGINYPMDTLLTLTGVTTNDDLFTISSDKQPTHIVNNLSEWKV